MFDAKPINFERIMQCLMLDMPNSKEECNVLEDEMLVHVDDGLTLNYFLEYEYYKHRFQGGSPEQVEALLFPFFSKRSKHGFYTF